MAPDFHNIMCRVFRNYFMNNFGLWTIQVPINRFLKLKIQGLPNWTKWSTLISWWQENVDVFFKIIWCLRALSNGIGPGGQAHGTHAICIHLSCWVLMFRGVKFGTINASQLFFEGSHVFSIFLFLFNLRIHACSKNKITTFYRWQWKYLTISDSSAVKICSIKAITVSKFVSSSKSFKKQWTLWDHVIPSAFYSFHLISFTRISRGPSHHKSGSLNNKYEYHSTSQSKERKSPMSNPFRHLVRATPKRPENPSGATAVVAGRVHRGPRRDQLLDHGGVASPSRVMQRRLASGAEDATRTAGRLRLPSRNKTYQMGCFSGLLGKYFWIGHR